MKTLSAMTLLLASLLAGGCDSSLKSTGRLRLPQGSAEAGKRAFVSLNCTRCHTVPGVELPKPTAPASEVLALGGNVNRLRTIGDLMTSIIHPSAALSEKMRSREAVKAGKSPMPEVNDIMTVQEMVDLVTFLQPQYKQLPPPADWYYML
ncbi:MAG: hypothetical protein RIQ93_2148 [Verrucomicrobiota bacterium]|jgi:mono/diheme cytochrome c family protein